MFVIGDVVITKLEDLDSYVGKSGQWRYCMLCNTKKDKSVTNVRYHIEAIHFAGTFEYPCDRCARSFNSKLSHRYHAKYCGTGKLPPGGATRYWCYATYRQNCSCFNIYVIFKAWSVPIGASNNQYVYSVYIKIVEFIVWCLICILLSLIYVFFLFKKTLGIYIHELDF